MSRYVINVTTALSVVFASGAILAIPPCTAGWAGELILLHSPSARVNGMGQAGVALTDEVGGFYNPAVLAFGAQKNTLASTFAFSDMPWRPPDSDDFGYRYTAVSYGWNSSRSTFLSSDSTSQNVSEMSYSLAAGFSRTHSQWRTQELVDNLGRVFETYDLEQYANIYTLSIAIHHIVDIGFGSNIKWLRDRVSSSATGFAYDFGLLSRLPIIDIITKSEAVSPAGFHPLADFAFGISWNNIGSRLEYANGNIRPLPRNRKLGISMRGGFVYGKGGISTEMITVNWSWQKQTHRTHHHNPLSVSEIAEGYEFGLVESFEYRRGRFYDDDIERNTPTRGWGVKSDGLAKLILAVYGKNDNHTWAEFAAMHISISWSKFRYVGPKFERFSRSQFTILLH